ncbi:MAG: exodeoxyribonuclease III [Candidatus Hydrogenedentes bacterium]|nr:exodeoxyribonuclease III [Candidatus Hydrogenedentota bacterium]
MTTILSWNVNGLRAALKNGFMEWFGGARPDVLCIQESRVLPEELDMEVLGAFGYHSYWNPAQKKGYSGTAVFSKEAPLSLGTMGVPEFDDEGRLQVIEYPEFTVLNGYWPNSQSERARLPYKLAWCDAVTQFANGLVKKNKNVVLCGDFNIAHTEIDLARPKDNENNAGYYIEEREAMAKFLGNGYVDTFRHLNPEKIQYSWWSYRTNARARNIGWRIDYHCVNKSFAPRVKAAWICDDVKGSDHCPVGVEIA